MAAQLTIKVESFGAKQSVHEPVVKGLVAGGAVKVVESQHGGS